MVVIASVAGGFTVDRALDVLEQPRIAVGVAPLHLMRRGRRTPQEPIREFHSVSMPASRTDTQRGGLRTRPRRHHAFQHGGYLEHRAITHRGDPAAKGLHSFAIE